MQSYSHTGRETAAFFILDYAWGYWSTISSVCDFEMGPLLENTSTGLSLLNAQRNRMLQICPGSQLVSFFTAEKKGNYFWSLYNFQNCCLEDCSCELGCSMSTNVLSLEVLYFSKVHFYFRNYTSWELSTAPTPREVWLWPHFAHAVGCPVKRTVGVEITSRNSPWCEVFFFVWESVHLPYFSWNHCIDRDSDINAERTRLMPKLFGKAFPHLNPLLWFIQIFLSVAHSRKLCWSKLQSYNIFHSTLSGIQQYFPFSRVCSISLRKLNFILPLVCKKSLVCDFS